MDHVSVTWVAWPQSILVEFIPATSWEWHLYVRQISGQRYGAHQSGGLMIRTGFSGLVRSWPVAPLFFVAILIPGAAGAVPNSIAQATQIVPSPDLPSHPHCELHVWPAETTHTTFLGWVHGGAVDGNRRGIKGYPNLYADALDTPQQVRLLSQIDWPAQTGDPGVHVTIHQVPTGSDDDRTRTSRLIADAGSCYREIIITASLVEAETFSSQSVRVVVLRKRFDGVGVSPVNFSTMSMAKIEVPEKNVPEFDEKMGDAVRNAFLAAFKKVIIIQSFH
jgi:hypothetical protein